MSVRVQFSPPAGIPATIEGMIRSAARSIWVCMYHLTEPTIANTLGDAIDRGLDVRVILDYNGAYDTASMAWQLAKRGVHVFTDHQHSQLHTKYAIFDTFTITEGSANWTTNADGRAAETFLVIEQMPSLAQQYQDNWNLHRSHSVPLPR